jgi:hypothetical protein
MPSPISSSKRYRRHKRAGGKAFQATRTDAFDFKGAALSPQAAVPDCNPPELVDDPTAPQFRDAAGKIIE